MTPSVQKARFVVVEGIDGSGSTTQAQRLAQRVTDSGFEVVLTHEPTTGEIGRFIREILEHKIALHSASTTSSKAAGFDAAWRSMALLFAADRMEHNRAVIEPALARGAWVVSDRYVLSSLAYQSLTSEGGAENLSWLRELNAAARPPDLTIVLDVSAELAAERRQLRGGDAELYEIMDLQKKLAQAYFSASELLPESHPVLSVNGEQSAGEVAVAIWNAVRQRWV